MSENRIVSATRLINAPSAYIFELIADPAAQPRWDGNDNLNEADAGQRIREVGDVFMMTNTSGGARENHVVEFDEGRRVTWMPSEPGKESPGHKWRWDLEPIDAWSTQVTHTYDWTLLEDESRVDRARRTSSENLQASLDRLAALAEAG